MSKFKAFLIKNRLSLAAAGVLAASVAGGAVVLHAQDEAEHVVSVAEINLNRSQVLFSGEDYYLESDQEDQYLEERALEELQKEQTALAVQQEDPSELAPSIVAVEEEPEEEEEYGQDQDFEVEEDPDQETEQTANQADDSQDTGTDQKNKKKPESQEKSEEASNTYNRSTQGRSGTGSTNRYVSPGSRYSYGRSSVTRTPTPTPTSGAKKKKESTYTAEIPTPVPTTKATVTPTPTTKATVTPTPTTKATVTPTPTTKPTVTPTPTPTPEPDIHISFRTPETESGTEPVYDNEKELNHESSIPELHVVSGEKLEFRLQGKDYKNHTFDADEYKVILILPDGSEAELTGEKNKDEDTGDVYIVYKTENPLEEGTYEIKVTVKDTDYTVSCIVTAEPVKTPTLEPTETPAPEPTETPTPEPTETPTPEPTETPAPEPTETPAPEPTETPTPEPTLEPTS